MTIVAVWVVYSWGMRAQRKGIFSDEPKVYTIDK